MTAAEPTASTCADGYGRAMSEPHAPRPPGELFDLSGQVTAIDGGPST